MKKYREIFIIIMLILFSQNSFAENAASPVGEWLVKDGTAHIRIVSCNNVLWGFTSWVQEAGVDDNNPDPKLRSRSTLGLPILLGMKAEDSGAWHGQIYNSENGKMYDSSIALESANILKVKGCLFTGFACGGENWTRLDASGNPMKVADFCQHLPL